MVATLWSQSHFRDVDKRPRKVKCLLRTTRFICQEVGQNLGVLTDCLVDSCISKAWQGAGHIKMCWRNEWAQTNLGSFYPSNFYTLSPKKWKKQWTWVNFFILIFSLSKQMVNHPPISLPPFFIPKSKKHPHFGKLLGPNSAFFCTFDNPRVIITSTLKRSYTPGWYNTPGLWWVGGKGEGKCQALSVTWDEVGGREEGDPCSKARVEPRGVWGDLGCWAHPCTSTAYSSTIHAAHTVGA